MTVDDRLEDALRIVATLPFVCDRDVAGLLAIDRTEARRLLAELDRCGWADWVAPRAAGSHPPHLYYLREEAMSALAERCGLAADDLAVVLPVGRQELLGRLARIASVTAVNRAVARLVADLRPRGTSVVDAVACPLRAPVLERWWPRAAMAYVEVEDDEGPRSVFVAWDRAGATDAARQAIGRAWRSRRGAAPGTAIALVCADARQLRTWERLLSGRARDGREVPDVVLAMAADVEEHGLLRARWRRPGSEADTPLCWGAARAPIAGREAHRRLARGELGEVGRTGAPLRRTLDRTRVRRLGVGERVAALAIALTPAELHLLAWTGLHPWLIERQIAVLTWDPPTVVRQRLAALERHGAISSVELPGLTEPGWHITDDGLRAFALAEHDQPRRLQRLGAVYVPRLAADGSGGIGLPRLLLHELGVNAVLVELAERARRDGGRLAVWQNTGEAACYFEGRRFWIRPDAAGILVGRDGETPFLLEYDRGTESEASLRAKFEGYERYYAAGAWDMAFDRMPVLLAVCAGYPSLQRVRRVAREVAGVPVLVVPESGGWWTRVDGATA